MTYTYTSTFKVNNVHDTRGVPPMSFIVVSRINPKADQVTCVNLAIVWDAHLV